MARHFRSSARLAPMPRLSWDSCWVTNFRTYVHCEHDSAEYAGNGLYNRVARHLGYAFVAQKSTTGHHIGVHHQSVRFADSVASRKVLLNLICFCHNDRRWERSRGDQWPGSPTLC